MFRVLTSSSDIHLLLRANYPYFTWTHSWNELYTLSERLKHATTITPMTWEKPNKNLVKVNFDGSALTNLGKIGSRAIVRDHQCQFIHAIT